MPPLKSSPMEPLVINREHEDEVLAKFAELEKLLKELGPVELLFSR